MNNNETKKENNLLQSKVKVKHDRVASYLGSNQIKGSMTIKMKNASLDSDKITQTPKNLLSISKELNTAKNFKKQFKIRFDNVTHIPFYIK